MTTQIARQAHSYRDAKGYVWTIHYHISYDDTSAATVFNGVQVAIAVEAALNGTGPGTLALTNGARAGSIGLYNVMKPLTYGTAAQYLNAEDKLMVGFTDSGGSLHRFGIGAPVTAAFLLDQETGKGSQLVDFVAAMTTSVTAAFACTPNGLKISSAVGSVLIRRRQRRKVSLYSKSSNLDEPGE